MTSKEPLILSEVYKQVPKDKRICPECGKTILRNVFLLDGVPYHWGCAKKTKALPTHRCLNCWNFLTKAGISKVDFGDGSPIQRTCGNCGSTEIKHIDRWWAEKYLQ